MDADERVMYTTEDLTNNDLIKETDVLCNFNGFVLPSMEDLQKYMAYPK
jgi:hypothetical protein